MILLQDLNGSLIYLPLHYCYNRNINYSNNNTNYYYYFLLLLLLLLLLLAYTNSVTLVFQAI